MELTGVKLARNPRQSRLKAMMLHFRHVTAGLVCGLAISGCGGGSQPGESSGAASRGPPLQINGAGAAFPNPIYSKWFDEYNKLHPSVRINYQSVGSGA